MDRWVDGVIDGWTSGVMDEWIKDRKKNTFNR